MGKYETNLMSDLYSDAGIGVRHGNAPMDESNL